MDGAKRVSCLRHDVQLATGPVGDDEVLRTMDLMRKAAAQQDLRGAGG